ncbi:hypothetical protein SDC9_06602 [bioreactor metagenome]|uniref:Uncharacterized protein n=1 Tax=bioreactor metagenome TaxID=1076179 RepID=A0A644T2B1_9ZZZZ
MHHGAGAVMPFGAARAPGDHHMRHRQRLEGQRQRRAQLRRLDLVHDQKRQIGQHRLDRLGLEGRGGIDDEETLFLPDPRRLDLGRGLVLQHQHIACTGAFQRRTHHRGIDLPVRAGMEQDRILARRIHRDDRMARGALDFGDRRAIDPRLGQPRHHPQPVGPDRADVAHRGPGAGQRHRLVRALAAEPDGIGQRRQRLSRRRQMRQPVEMIGIDRAQGVDGHAAAFLPGRNTSRGSGGARPPGPGSAPLAELAGGDRGHVQDVVHRRHRRADLDRRGHAGQDRTDHRRPGHLLHQLDRDRSRMPRRHDQHVRRPGQTTERIVLHLLHVQRDIDGHFAIILEIDAALIQNLRRDVHLRRPFRHRIAEGRERAEGHPRLEPERPRDLRPRGGDVGKVMLVGPFMHQRVADQHHTPLVQQRGDPHRPVRGARVEDLVDQLHHMAGLARRAGHHAVAMAMRQHQRSEDVAVAVGQLVRILAVHALALQPGVEEVLVGLDMLRIGRVHHGQLAIGIAEPRRVELLAHVALAADDQRPAHAVALIGHRGAQHARIVALGEDHRRLRLPRPRLDALQDRRRRVHPRLQPQNIGLHVDDRPARDAGVHPGPGDRGRDHVDQPRVEGRRDDVVAPEGQLAAIGDRHLVGHVLAGQLGQGLGAGDLHLVVDRTGMDVERAAEEIGEAQNVVHLVRIIRPAGRHDRIGAHAMRLFRGDLGIGVRHREDHRVVGHLRHHLGRHRALGRNAEEDVGAHHRLFQRARVGLRRMRRFPLVHALGAALPDHALGVAHDAVVVLCAHGLDQLEAGDAGGAGAVQHDPAVLDLLAAQLERVDQASRADHRRAVLIVMEHRNVHDLLQPLLDDEALGRLDVLEVDAAEGRAHQAHRLDDLVRVLGIKLDVDGVDVGKALEQHRLAFHHRLRGERAQIAEAEDGGAVRDDRHHVALDCVVIGGLWPLGDRLDRNRDARAVGKAQIALRRHRLRRRDLVFPGLRVEMIRQRLFGRDAVLAGHGAELLR